MPSAKKILYVVNGAAFFSRRLAVLAKAAENSGYEVHVATPDGAEAGRIAETGFHFHKIPFTRSGVGPWSEFKTYLELESLYRRLKPCPGPSLHHQTRYLRRYRGQADRGSGRGFDHHRSGLCLLLQTLKGPVAQTRPPALVPHGS